MDYSILFQDKWASFPLTFKTEKPVLINNPTNEFIPQKKYNEFYSAPTRQGEISMVRFLKENFGFKEQGVLTFKTGLINSKSITEYNNVGLKLLMEKDKVLLIGCFSNCVLTLCSWNIDELHTQMNSKNSNNPISKSMVKTLLNTGKLGVKFQVSHIKDHGTKWKTIS